MGIPEQALQMKYYLPGLGGRFCLCHVARGSHLWTVGPYILFHGLLNLPNCDLTVDGLWDKPEESCEAYLRLVFVMSLAVICEIILSGITKTGGVEN